MKIIIPKTYIEISEDVPVFFLAGPVRGGDDWQRHCLDFIEEHELKIRKTNPQFECFVAIPYYMAILPTNHIAVLRHEKGDENYFPRQLAWERYYLDRASVSGSIIFWLPEESIANPRIGGGPYATDTRGELGEWRGRMMYKSDIHIAIGGETGFPGIDIIERNFKHVVGGNFVLHTSLEETVQMAFDYIIKT